MEHSGVHCEINDPVRGKTVAYRLKSGVVVIGRYQSACGGCDTIHTLRAITDAVVFHAQTGPVVFEGFLWSGLFKCGNELALEVAGRNKLIFATLDTSVSTCVSRVIKRREAAGNFKPFNPASVIHKHRSVIKAHCKLEAAGWDTRLLSHRDPLPTMLEWLVEVSESL
jgi:hypothetical protein